MLNLSLLESYNQQHHLVALFLYDYFQLFLPILSPNSNAAFKVIAFCNPIPLTCIKSLIEDFFNSFRFEADLSSSLLMSMLENPFLPVLINIANNSVFERLLHHGLTNVLLAFPKLPFL